MTSARMLCLALSASLLLAASGASAATEWDQARVSALAKDLVSASEELYDTFFKQPRITSTPNAVRDYERLEREIRRIKQTARGFAGDVSRGESKEETQKAYESILVQVNWARERARSVFTTQDVNARAEEVRTILEQIGTYYEGPAPAPATD
jgi:hypothetical protein